MSETIDFEVECATCGADLKIRKDGSRTVDLKILVEPCEACLEKEWQKGHTE